MVFFDAPCRQQTRINRFCPAIENKESPALRRAFLFSHQVFFCLAGVDTIQPGKPKFIKVSL